MAETWVLNEVLVITGTVVEYTKIGFTSNAKEWIGIAVDSGVLTYVGKRGNTEVYIEDNSPEWEDQAYRTITFLEPPTGNLLTWLQANGVKQQGKHASKVVVNGETILDLTQDTVTPATLAKGATAHDKSGAQITGTLSGYDTSDATVTASDLAEGVVAYGKNGRVVGDIVKSALPSNQMSLADTTIETSDIGTSDGTIWFKGNFDEGTVIASKSRIGIYIDFLGNATAADVAKGKRFTSAAGLNVVGTAEGSAPGAPGAPGDITFYDYDGTIVTSWTLAELATKTALPDYPSHEGLTCQGWNWSLADLKTANRKMNVGAMYITDDGKTRIYIRLEEGRTSPMLGVCPNGTVTVDWGDGTTPATLTGTSTTTVKWTPDHAYAAPGEYVINLTVNGTMGFYGSNSIDGGAILLYSSSNDRRNNVYRNSVQKIEIGNGVTSIGSNTFYNCYSLASITIPDGVTSIGSNTFYNCRSLASITIPNGVTSIEPHAFNACYSLASITIPDGITSIGQYAFNSCFSLASITIPNGVTSIGQYAFSGCGSVAFYDFTACTTVPTLSNKNAFTNIPADCQIRVPASLVNAWKAATNWSTYANHIVGV